MIVVVSGTPATGKTTVAKLIEQLGFQYIDGNAIAKQFSTGYDDERDCDIIETRDYLTELAYMIDTNKDMVIDSHLAHELPKRLVDVVIITTCNRKILVERMRAREYHDEKIEENLEAEIFDTCYEEARALDHHVVKVDTTTTPTVEQIKQILKK
jgi:adenylate kinase